MNHLSTPLHSQPITAQAKPESLNICRHNRFCSLVQVDLSFLSFKSPPIRKLNCTSVFKMNQRVAHRDSLLQELEISVLKRP